MPISTRILGPSDTDVLARLDPGVFDGPVVDELVREFLDDPRHHLAVADDETSTVVDMASALHYVHPNKPPQLFINEIGVADSRRQQGIGLLLVKALLANEPSIGCREAWVATEEDNTTARALYLKAHGKQAPNPPSCTPFDLSDDHTDLEPRAD